MTEPAKSEIQRYGFFSGDFEKSPNGDYVTYTDHEAAVAAAVAAAKVEWERGLPAKCEAAAKAIRKPLAYSPALEMKYADIILAAMKGEGA